MPVLLRELLSKPEMARALLPEGARFERESEANRDGGSPVVRVPLGHERRMHEIGGAPAGNTHERFSTDHRRPCANTEFCGPMSNIDLRHRKLRS